MVTSGDKGSSKKAQKVMTVINKTSSCSRKEVGSWDSLDGMGVAEDHRLQVSGALMEQGPWRLVRTLVCVINKC